MTYNADEQGVYTGKPIELYEFVGTFATYRYTSHSEDVVYLGDVYTRKAIKRGAIKIATPQGGTSDLEITMPSADPLIQAYAFNVAPPDLRLTLTRFHNDAAPVVYWTGPCTAIKVRAAEGSITSPNNLSTVFATDTPSAFYQGLCNHALGDARCKVDLDPLKVNTIMVEWFGNDITVLGDGGHPDGYFVNGIFATPTEGRTIIAHVGNVLTLSYPLSKYRSGLAVILTPGCNHAWAGDCSNSKFDNQINFGGYPFIPQRNPFTDGMA